MTENNEAENLKAISIVVAGASGYIGRAVIPQLKRKFPNATITGFSRAHQSSDTSDVQWRDCDLFSLKSLEAAMPQHVDLALYLVHSMGPTAQLDQGTFADYDLILADNFARALKKFSPKHLIYLAGLIPQEGELSLHLQSRLEVEETFRQYKFPMTVLRAGLILGKAGSSFQILLKLVTRLPVMLCPSWTQTLTTPVDLQTVVETIAAVSLDENHVNKVYDLFGCQPLTYVQMMRDTAKRLGLRRLFLPVPFFTPTLSRLWVSLITNTPKALVYPLVESLRHKMVARPSHVFSQRAATKTYADLLATETMETYPGRSIFRGHATGRSVRSVQRIALPPGRDAEWVKDQYFAWLPKAFYPLLRVETLGPDIFFSFITKQPVLLQLRHSPERSQPDRQLLYIQKSMLANEYEKGRLEFRIVLNRKFVLAAIHDFRPSLPWFLYKLTQAKMHLWVMRAFGRFLNKST